MELDEIKYLYLLLFLIVALFLSICIGNEKAAKFEI
jgi:hypothetical protein